MQCQNLGRRLTSVTTCFSFFRGAMPRLAIATHLCDYLLFPSSGVQCQNLGRRLTSVTTCFSFFRGTRPELVAATHLCDYLLFLLPGCSASTSNSDPPRNALLFPVSGVPNSTFANRRLISHQNHTPQESPQKPPPTPRGPAFRLVPRNIS